VNNQVLHVKQAAEDFQPGKEEKLRRAWGGCGMQHSQHQLYNTLSKWLQICVF
jgi:hypothetical protein